MLNRADLLLAALLALAGGLVAFRRLKPEFRARNRVEGWIGALLVASSALAILTTVGIVLAGVLLALGFHHFVLARLVRRNMARIERYADKGCLFAFQAWRSYGLILVMVVLGALLRHTALPREILAVLYTAMGGALVLSSLAYFAGLRHRPGE